MKLVSTTAKAGPAVLALALASATPVPAFAQADVSASARLSGYELVDLDLGDGVTPWLSFKDNGLLWSQASIFPGSSSDAYPLAESTNWSADTAAVESGANSARAQAGWSEVFSSASGGPNLVVSSALTQRAFLLSPNTSVTFFFDTDLATTPGENTGVAAAGMRVTFGSEAFPRTELVLRDGEQYSGYLAASADFHGTGAAQGILWMSTFAASYAAAAPVPEPAAPAMLLGGLGLLGAGRRLVRRRT
jgi:hypothetical protein